MCFANQLNHPILHQFTRSVLQFSAGVLWDPWPFSSTSRTGPLGPAATAGRAARMEWCPAASSSSHKHKQRQAHGVFAGPEMVLIMSYDC